MVRRQMFSSEKRTTRLGVGLAASLVLSTLAVASGSNVAQAVGCADGEIAVSGDVKNGDASYETWVEVAVGTDSPIQSAGWLPHLAGQPVQTGDDGTFTLCVPSSIEAWDHESDEPAVMPVASFQVFAFPDLTDWSGSSAPSVGYSAGAIVPLANASQSQTVQMQAPTIWAHYPDQIDYFRIRKAIEITDDHGTYTMYDVVAGLPAHLPATGQGGLSATGRGKMAAAFPFDEGVYRAQGYSDVGNPPNPYDDDDSSEFVLSFDRSVTNGGSFGEVESPNFYAELAYPVGFPAPDWGQNGPSDTPWPDVFLVRLSDECAGEQWRDEPGCFEEIDRYEPDKLVAHLAEDTPYALAARFDTLPLTTVLFQVTNGGIAYTDDPNNSPIVRGAATIDNPFVLTLAGPKMFVETSAPDSNPSSAISIHAEKCSTDQNGYMSCWNWVPTEQPAGGSNGLFGWSPSDGIWKITLNNSWEYEYSATGPNWAWTPFYVKVQTVQGSTSIVSSCDHTVEFGVVCPDVAVPVPTNSNGAYRFMIDDANVIVRVIDLNGDPYSRGSVSFGPSQGFSMFGTGVSSNGHVGLNLSSSNDPWTIVASPDRNDLEQAATEQEISVGTASPASPRILDIQLSEPNLRGQVLKPSGATSRFSQLGIQVFDEELNHPVNVQWAQTNSDGRFSINLQPGVYRLILEAPPSDPGLPRTSFFLLVDSQGDICEVSSFDDVVCQSQLEIGQDGFLFRFAEANLSGRVTDDNGAGVSGWMSASQWNERSDEWDWSVDIGTQVNQRGQFSLYLPEGNTFRLTVEPHASSGAARSEVFVYVSPTGNWCIPDVEELWPQTPSECVADNSEDFDIELPGANFYGFVKDEGLAPVPYGWVDVAYETSFGYQGSSGGQVMRDGSFKVRIESPGTEWVGVRVTANPPWGTSDLVKQSQFFWVKGDQICERDERPEGSCPAASAITRNTVQEFTLGAGNVRGTIFLPGVDANGDPLPARFVHVSVEKKSSDGWWEWVDLWAQSDSQGRYSLGLSETGDYRITARPWGLEGVSQTSIELRVDGTCSECAQADIALSPPNVTAVIEDGVGNKVSRAWVAVERKITSGSNTWWEWTGFGDDSDAEGNVSIAIPVTSTSETYRLVVHGPWGGSVTYPRFVSDEFELRDADGLREAAFVTPPLEFPQGNVNIKLLSAENGPVVPNAWVGIERKVSDGNGGFWWEWAGVGTNTSVGGKASLYLEECDPSCTLADFRIVVESPWGSSTTYPRFTMTLDQVDLQDNDLADTSFDVVWYPTSNLDGQVWINNSTVNRNGWIDVFDDATGQWVAGVPLNMDGKFAVYLADGGYSLRIHGNQSASVPSIDLSITVQGGLMTQCQLASGADCSALDPTVPNPLDLEVSFALVPKNLVVVVTRDDEALTTPAYVSIINTATGQVRNVMTDATGRLEIDVPAGTYDIRATLALDDGSVLSLLDTGLAIALANNPTVEIDLG